MVNDEEIDISLSDITRHLLTRYHIKQFEKADISNLPAGLYQVTLHLSNNSILPFSLQLEFCLKPPVERKNHQ